MEDFIKVLIWLIIIISFFSLVFKKKNKEKPKVPQSPNRDNEENIPKSVEPQNKKVEDRGEIESYNDMLSEIENLFKKDNGRNITVSQNTPLESSPQTKTSDKTKIEEHEAKKKSAKYNDSQWHKETASEHTLINDWEREEKVLEKKAAVDFRIENKAKKFEEIINQKPEPIGLFKHTIKEKLRHPATLKDYILMSEIIGRPKAKRR